MYENLKRSIDNDEDLGERFKLKPLPKYSALTDETAGLGEAPKTGSIFYKCHLVIVLQFAWVSPLMASH